MILTRGIEFSRARLYAIETAHPNFRYIKSVTFRETYYMSISCFDTGCAFFRSATVDGSRSCLVDVQTIEVTPEMNACMRIDNEDSLFVRMCVHLHEGWIYDFPIRSLE